LFLSRGEERRKVLHPGRKGNIIEVTYPFKYNTTLSKYGIMR